MMTPDDARTAAAGAGAGATPGTRAAEQPDDHRRAEPDEADRPGQGDRGGGEQHREQRDHEPGRPHVEPEHGGGVVAEGEDVQPVPEPRHQRGRREHHDGRELGERGQVGLHERTVAPGEQPDGGLLKSSRSSVVSEPSAIAVAEPARISRVRHAAAWTAAGRQQHHQPGGGEPAAGSASPPAATPAARVPNAAAATIARCAPALTREGVRRGERIAGQRLQGGAGEAERDADGEPGEQPRKSGGDQHPGRVLVVGAGEQPQQVGGARPTRCPG